MRVFVAVELNQTDIIKKITDVQSKLNIKAKPVEAHNLHFTLQFLGEVSGEMIHDISSRIRTIKFSEFSVNFQNLGVFPKPKFPRVVWVGTDSEGGNSLVELSKKVENVLNPLGFQNDKPFKPHITIFRIKNKIGDISKELERFSKIEFGIQKISEFKLKQSELTPKGPIYSDLEVIKAC